jgi:hypothetical protein
MKVPIATLIKKAVVQCWEKDCGIPCGQVLGEDRVCPIHGKPKAVAVGLGVAQ